MPQRDRRSLNIHDEEYWIIFLLINNFQPKILGLFYRVDKRRF